MPEFVYATSPRIALKYLGLSEFEKDRIEDTGELHSEHPGLHLYKVKTGNDEEETER